MAMAQHLDAGFNREQPLFGWRKLIAAGKEVSCDCLGVTTDEGAPGTKRLAEMVRSRRCVGDARLGYGLVQG